MSPLLTVRDVAQMLSLSPSKVYEMAGKTLRCVRIDGAIRFRQEDVEDYVGRCVVEVKLEPRRAPATHLKHIRI